MTPELELLGVAHQVSHARVTSSHFTSAGRQQKQNP